MKKVIKDIFLEVHIQFLKKLHEPHNNLQFVPTRMKVENFVANLRDKTGYVIHVINLK